MTMIAAVSELNMDGFGDFDGDNCYPEVADDYPDGFLGFSKEETQPDMPKTNDSEVEVDRGRSTSQFGRAVSP